MIRLDAPLFLILFVLATIFFATPLRPVAARASGRFVDTNFFEVDDSRGSGDEMPNVAPQPDVYDYYRRGIQLFQEGKYPEAFESFLEAVRLDPEMHRTLFWVGRTLEELGRPEEATFYYDEMIRVKSRKALEGVDDSQPLLPDITHASERIEAIDRRIEDAGNLYQEGKTLLESGKWREAASRFGLAAQLVPGAVEYHMARGRALYDAGLHGMAITALRKARALEPENMEILQVLADIHEKAGNDEDLKGIYRQMLAIGPEDARIRERLSVIIKGEGKENGRFSIVRREGDTVYIDAGLLNGLGMGMEFKTRFVVFVPGEDILNLEGFERIGQAQETAVGEILLTSTGDRMSQARVMREFGRGIRAGDRIRLR